MLWNCKQDEVLETLTIEQATPNYSQRMVSLTKIPEVEKYLKEKLPKNSFQRTNPETGISMSYDAVLELVDSLENVSYSIRFTFDDSPQGEFFNLVVGKTVEGEMTQPKVLGFVCDEEQLETFVAHHYDMNYFIGEISLYNYLDFFSQDRSSRANHTARGSIDIEPCDEQTYTGGGGDPYDNNNPGEWNPIDPEGTGGGSGLGDIDTSGGGSSCSWSWGTTGPCGAGGTAVHSAEQCGVGTGVSLVLTINCAGVNRSTQNTDDLGCGEPIPIGVNSEEGQITLDDEFKDTPCLNSVYKRMAKQSSGFKNYLQNFEEDFSVANLHFTADDNFSGNEDEEYHNAMAITKPPLNNNEIKIKFNTDPNTLGNILDKPDVFKAVSMIHEVIHAEMFRKMLDAVRHAEINSTNLNWTTWTNPTDFKDFVESLENKYFGIFDFYTRFEWDSPIPNDPQHQLMADRYRTIVKQSLTHYDSTLTEEQKEALSWIGLDGANIVAWQNLSPNERTAINDLQTQIKNTFPNGCD